MTNGEKYKTVQERTEAFDAFCDSHGSNCEGCPLEKACDDGTTIAGFAWLDLEAEEEKPLPCPFCGQTSRIVTYRTEQFRVECALCGYASKGFCYSEDSVAAHNRVARAVMAAKDKEAK